IDHESRIEPWLAPYNRPACKFQTPNGVVTTIRMKPLGWKNQIASPDCAIGRSSGVLGENKTFLHYVGWMSGQKNLRLPVDGEVFFLTSPFIVLHGTWQQAVQLDCAILRLTRRTGSCLSYQTPLSDA